MGLKIFDISDKKNISYISSCDTFYTASGLFVDNDYAYIADSLDGIQIIDIKDVKNPMIVGVYETDGNALDVYIEENLAYIADS